MENNNDTKNSDKKRTYEQPTSVTNSQSKSVSNNDTTTNIEDLAFNVNNVTDTIESVQSLIEETSEILDLSTTRRDM